MLVVKKKKMKKNDLLESLTTLFKVMSVILKINAKMFD